LRHGGAVIRGRNAKRIKESFTLILLKHLILFK